MEEALRACRNQGFILAMRVVFLVAVVSILGCPRVLRAGKSFEPRTAPEPAAPRGKIGAVLSSGANGEVVIVQVLSGSPAETAGLLGGDEILEVDGKTTRSRTLSEVVDLITGPVGSKVQLTILRKGRRFVTPVARAKESNAALMDPGVRSLVQRLVAVQGGEDRIRRVTALSILLRGSLGARKLSLRKQGLLEVSCPKGAPPEVELGLDAEGHVSGRRGLQLSSVQLERERTSALRPHLSLENLRVVEFSSPEHDLRYLGAGGARGRAANLVEAFMLDGEKYEFDARSGTLVRHTDRDGVETTFGGWRRSKGLLLPGWRKTGTSLERYVRIDLAPQAAPPPSTPPRCD
jgi:hypothetical protein